MSIWRFILVSLFAYRAQRIVTADEWPPSIWFRDWLQNHKETRQGAWTHLYKFFTCSWCFGFWVVVATFTFDHYDPIPWIILYIGAASTIVGQIGQRDE